MEKAIRFLPIYVGTLFLFISSGCTIAGLAAGIAADSSGKTQEYSASNILDIPVKSKVQLIMNDATKRKGQYVFYATSLTDESSVISVTCIDESTNQYFLTPLADINKIVVNPKKDKQFGGVMGAGVGLCLDIILVKSVPDFGGGPWFSFGEDE